MGTSNDEYRDAVLRHQIGVRRFSTGLNKRVAELLEENDRDLVEILRVRLGRFKGQEIDFNSKKWKDLISKITLERRESLLEAENMITPELKTLAVMEGAREINLLTEAVPIKLSFNEIPDSQLKAIVTERPFFGHRMKEWFAALSNTDRNRLTRSIQLGMIQGESINNIVRRVAGTRTNSFKDGDLSIARRDARTIVTTAVNHVSNAARDEVWEENIDVITARIWTATLDGHTSAICRKNDGKGAPLGNNKLPDGVAKLDPINSTLPAHPNERSVWTGYIDGLQMLGSRPFVLTSRNEKIDFRKMAREQGRSIKEVRADWAKKHIGEVPAQTNYPEFLKRQAVEFQEDVLGKTKATLFRKGDLSLEEYVDSVGNEITLKQLAATKPQAFMRAGLEPEDFL
jgi:hypothetical protein